MVSSPRISIGPAGCRINRDYARRGWAQDEPESLKLGGPEPGLERWTRGRKAKRRARPTPCFITKIPKLLVNFTIF